MIYFRNIQQMQSNDKVIAELEKELRATTGKRKRKQLAKRIEGLEEFNREIFIFLR